MLIQTIDAPEPAIRERILAVLEAYNDERTGQPEPPQRFGVLVHDAGGAVVGGALVVAYYGWAFVEMLALPEAMRGQGIGTRIMRSVENEAARRGCRGVWLDTASYQAPAFYQKLGFTPFARIDDYITGHDRFWFRKTPIGGGQDQGLAIVDEPDEASRRGVSETLSAYNTARVGPGGWRHVAVVLREDEESPSLGGLWGRFGRDWLFIELLGLPEARRGQGIGRRIMADAEAAARQAGCRGIWLDTFSFQARPFYERLGYTCLGEIPDYPPPHSRFLLARRLDGAPLLRDTASAQPRNPR